MRGNRPLQSIRRRRCCCGGWVRHRGQDVLLRGVWCGGPKCTHNNSLTLKGFIFKNRKNQESHQTKYTTGQVLLPSREGNSTELEQTKIRTKQSILPANVLLLLLSWEGNSTELKHATPEKTPDWY